MLIRSIVAAAVGVFAAGGSATAIASTTWATVGAGCVPTGQTSHAHMQFQTAGRTGFASGKVGEIVLTCPITTPLSSASRLYLYYVDSDGASTGASVSALLRRVNRATGAVSNVPLWNEERTQQIASLTSNHQGPASSWTRISRPLGEFQFGGPSHNFAFNDYFYYVQINMRRSSISQTASFGGIKVTD
jgi:hypothetical protein